VKVDLNADLGESYGSWRMGDDDALLDVVTSANVACGFHAGGSRATDTLSGLGPRPLAAGDVLPLGEAAPPTRAVVAPLTPPAEGTVTLEAMPGPRTDWLADPALDGEWTVAPDSNRVGVRLTGHAWPRARTDELPSEGVVRGSIQLPPDGRPVLFGPDHPITGGYPVVGVLTDTSCDLLAQLRPGQRVRFRAVAK